MKLSKDLISRFVKATHDPSPRGEATVYGQVVRQGDSAFVKFDGSELLTPVQATADMKNNDRVMVLVKNHTATVIGNVSSPAARLDDVEEIRKLAVGEIDADRINVDDLVAFGATIGGWHISDDSLYAGVKDAVDNVSRGAFLGSDGQFNFGDADNFIMFYVDKQGESHLALSADQIRLGKQNIADVIENVSDLQLGTTNYLANSRTMAGYAVYEERPLTTASNDILYTASGEILTHTVKKEVDLL